MTANVRWVSKTGLVTLVKSVNAGFEALADNCPHRTWDGADCAHPNLEFSCMCCYISNCPLLGEPVGGEA